MGVKDKNESIMKNRLHKKVSQAKKKGYTRRLAKPKEKSVIKAKKTGYTKK